MSSSVVADASMAIAWIHSGQATDESDELLKALETDTLAVAPALFPIEIANTLLVLVRRGIMTELERQNALGRFSNIPVRLDFEFPHLALTSLSTLASTHRLSVYDAAYLELAQRTGFQLATKDKALRAAAAKVGVELWK